MKFLKIIYLSVFLVTLNSTAQTINIPPDLQLDNEEDYKQTEELFLESYNWTQQNTLAVSPEKRKVLNEFMMKWMLGSPTVSIELFPNITPMECNGCLMAFMTGWTAFSLKNNYSSDKVACALAGAESAIAHYEKNKDRMAKDRVMKKLVKQKSKGKLEAFIASKIN